MPNDVELLIIGGGAAGLGTAWYLAHDPLHRPRSLQILETRDRTGGRVFSDPNYPSFDYGGAYLGPDQRHVWGVLERLVGRNLNGRANDHDSRQHLIRNFFPSDKHTFWQDSTGRVTTCQGNYPLTPQAVALIAIIETLVEALRIWTHTLGKPVWTFPLARRLDALNPSQFLYGWFQGATQPYTEEILDLAVRSAFSVETPELSMLYLLQYSVSCGGFLAFEEVNGGGDSHRLRKGFGWLLQQVREGVEAVWPEAVHTTARATRIEHDEQGVRVTLADDTVVTADRVVVAVSPGVWRNIAGNFLTDGQRALAQAMVAGRTRKVFVKYDTAWWRGTHSGYGLSHLGPIDWLMDNCTDDPANPDRVVTAALMAFIVGDQVPAYENLASDQERQQYVCAHIATILEDDRALGGTLYHSSEPGKFCPAAVFPPGILTQYRTELREPNGRVYFAASELGREWTGGYVNGALASAEYTALELLRELGGMVAVANAVDAADANVLAADANVFAADANVAAAHAEAVAAAISARIPEDLEFKAAIEELAAAMEIPEPSRGAIERTLSGAEW